MKVQGRPITGISIKFPPGLRVTESIDVETEPEQALQAHVELNSDAVTISFLQPVQPDTRLKITLQGVNGWHSSLDTWLYPIAVRYAGETQDTAIGTAQITTYRNQ